MSDTTTLPRPPVASSFEETFPGESVAVPAGAEVESAASGSGKNRFWWVETLPFVLCHVALIGIFFTGFTWGSVTCCVVLFFARMFGITGGYHRYFSHRTFKTSRVFHFLLGFLAETSAQKGVLWWAAHHRHHHKYSDKENDIHSPRHDGFWYAHLGWLFDDNSETDYSKIRDLAKYPELMLLNRFWIVPPFILGFSVWLLLGWPGLFVGFFLSTFLTWHATFAVNSLTHMFGRQRYSTGDDSRNSFLIALVTMGEGWHNNHHHYMNAARQGFYWWEIDPTYYVLRILKALGIIWNVNEPPDRVLEQNRKTP